MRNGTFLSVINSAKIYHYFTGNQAGDASVNVHYSEWYEMSPYVLLGPKITTRIICVNDLRQRLPTYVLYVCSHGRNTRRIFKSFREQDPKLEFADVNLKRFLWKKEPGELRMKDWKFHNKYTFILVPWHRFLYNRREYLCAMGRDPLRVKKPKVIIDVTRVSCEPYFVIFE